MWVLGVMGFTQRGGEWLIALPILGMPCYLETCGSGRHVGRNIA